MERDEKREREAESTQKNQGNNSDEGDKRGGLTTATSYRVLRHDTHGAGLEGRRLV